MQNFVAIWQVSMQSWNQMPTSIFFSKINNNIAYDLKAHNIKI